MSSEDASPQAEGSDESRLQGRDLGGEAGSCAKRGEDSGLATNAGGGERDDECQRDEG